MTVSTDLHDTPLEFYENIRLVIWDLDETFWQGTLTEGGITYSDDNHRLVIQLAERGVMSTICSKNDHKRVESLLREHGIWEYFIFPSIDWSPKAPRIMAQIEQIGLRPPTVLFVDDNPQNLQQAASHIPGLNIASPLVIKNLSESSYLAGRPDPELTRLNQYKNLEKKEEERVSYSGEHIDFLRSSDIRVYFEFDLEKHLDRVIELINRTNQLNFTKKRLSEDPDVARQEALQLVTHMDYTTGLVRVVDKYGDYGFVGFFAMTNVSYVFTLQHFCFSCRTINMYIEHFVYEHLKRPNLEIIGEVISDIKSSNLEIDWIKALPADKIDVPDDEGVVKIGRLYMRGGCDLGSLIHYFSLNCSHVTSEMNILKNWQSLRLDHSNFLIHSLDGLTPEQLRAAETLGYDADDFVTAFPRDDPDTQVALIGFWADADVGLFRHRESGFEIPYFLIGCENVDLRVDDVSVTRHIGNPLVKERIEQLRAHWDYRIGLTRDEMAERYSIILRRFSPKTRVFVSLANDRHRPYFAPPPNTFPEDWIVHRHCDYNDAMRQASEGLQNVSLIDFGSYIKTIDDLLDMNHLRRHLYYCIYQDIIERVGAVRQL